jgi:cytochrome c peroxidase
MSAAASLGELIFKDTSLSASGQMSCATCHDPNRGHASPFDTPVAFGGPHFPGDVGPTASGLRAPPTLRYLRFNTAFRWVDGQPVGGFFWDGRANSLAEQAKGPFLGPFEMGNTSVEAVVVRLASTPYAERFKVVFGADILNHPDLAFERMAFALERYQIEDPAFAPFSSKFDAVVAGRATFSPSEQRGALLFNRRDKGNCAACHPSTAAANAPGALFTDFSYDSLGVPRQPLIAANQDPAFFDLGLCGPVRNDLRERKDLCGKFKVPTLRNVALRKVFFHNGRFHRLEDVVLFYVTRDSAPSAWYPIDVYDDLPATWRGNVNTSEAPYHRSLGQTAALNALEIADLIAFLHTLTDGYTP